MKPASPASHLVSLCLVLLCAGQSLAVQYLTLGQWQGFLLPDLAAACVLVLCCGPRLLRVCLLLQGLFSLFCLSYAKTLGMPPTLADLVNGTGYVAGMGLTSLFSYVDASALIWLAACCLTALLLCGRKARYGRARRWALVPLAVLVAAHVLSLGKQPLGDFFPQSYTSRTDKNYFASPGRRSLKWRGYLASFTLELTTGAAWSFRNIQPAPCDAEGIATIPVPPASPHVALIQVESLDWELLNREVNGEQVMPFLHSLLSSSVVLRLNGDKKLASANSDFEVFNGQDAASSMVHYEFLLSYPRSIFACLARDGRAVMAFHGLPADYMNLGAAYPLMGIGDYRALERLRADGLTPLPCWWAGVIRDEDLLAYAARHQPDGPFVQFSITMNMHLPEHVKLLTDTLLFDGAPDAAFLTTARTTDNALRDYVAALPGDALIILWGDHRSYGRTSGDIPFIVHSKGRSHPFDGSGLQGLTRCKMYHYLRKILACPPLPEAGDAPHCPRQD